MPPTPAIPGAHRRIILAGASGLVGGHLLNGLLSDESVVELHCIARRPLPLQHPKLRMHVVDLAMLPELPSADEAYLALGTTIKVAGSREAFRAIDHDANLAVARAAFEAGARRFGLVSAMAADKDSRVFYNRVKGELEDALTGLATTATVIARPSLLLGDRERLAQPGRPGEKIAQAIMTPLRWMLPRDYRPIAAEKVARALLAEVPASEGTRILSSGELQRY
ncbi:oxidoreductase [Luteolibacter sp. LG18]|uniref:oxidoreductase n=1 Tax=Luteolibacter sp. LG18 TaxID=2819286 RepID=UPI002B2CB1E3|nr:oxidoreductase [Luteolibacter sp. LG18]